MMKLHCDKDNKCVLTGEVSRHHDKVICVTGGGVLAAAAAPGRILEEKPSGLLGWGGQSFGTQMLPLGKRLLQRRGDRPLQVNNEGIKQERGGQTGADRENTASLLR